VEELVVLDVVVEVSEDEYSPRNFQDLDQDAAAL
jgi:hypothetical protein